MEYRVNIIGAGLGGLSAALTLAKKGIPSRLISRQPSERAQSVLAEGGINAALDNMGEGDKPEFHAQDTMRSGGNLADPEAVKGFTEGAPGIVRDLIRLGVPFQVENGVLMQRPFGGQKKRRTVYAKSSTGKIVMTALISEARKYEAEGIIQRFDHHVFAGLILESQYDNRRESRSQSESGVGRFAQAQSEPGIRAAVKAQPDAGSEQTPDICHGVRIQDDVTGEFMTFRGPVILAVGGMNGFFPGITTGTTANTGDAQAILFMQGVRFGNLEMIQYHPTTMQIPGKRCLVSEAARGEGGRLFIRRHGEPWYFMEEKYPEMGNLMPRDVVSREMYFVLHDPECEGQVYLDMTALSEHIWQSRLADLREEVIYYQGIDPKKEPLPVDPSIHYFMGGIDVDIHHRTSVNGLYAAGECCCQYHGANRLGGNSMMGALYGGKTAAEDLAERWKGNIDVWTSSSSEESPVRTGKNKTADPANADVCLETGAHLSGFSAAGRDEKGIATEARFTLVKEVAEILTECMGIVRNGEDMRKGLSRLDEISGEVSGTEAADDADRGHVELARAMILSALERKESRGAHYRTDYPDRDPAFEKQTTAEYRRGGIRIAFKEKQ